MKNAVIVPGRPDKDEYYDANVPANSDNHWYPWIAKRLQMLDVHAVVLEPPFPFRPRYDEWKQEFERFAVDQETVLIGHSCGGGFLLRWLSENPEITVGSVVLVAPWLNPDDVPGADTADFFDFKIDPAVVDRAKSFTVFSSDNDFESIQKTVEIIRETIPNVHIVDFHERGHFCKEDSGSVEFSELLEELTK